MQIAGYEIIEQIGAGALGLVFKARQVSLGRLVAIKVLRPELKDDSVAIAQFRLEANAVANLKHPNILSVHEAGDVEGRPFFVMEYVSAYSVGQWLQRKGRLSEADALTVADSIARALKYAWDRAGLIHCDIKPDNILVDEDGIVKVADFSGLSRDHLLPESEVIRHFTIGTPNYMSPEQVNGLLDLDCRVDMYSLGALLYHMTTGVLPFAGMSDEEAMRAQVAGYLPDPLEICPQLSSPIVTLMEKLLIKDRNARGPDWDSVIRDIAQVRSGRNPHPPLPLPGASTLQRSVPRVFGGRANDNGPRGVMPRRQIILPEKMPPPEFPRMSTGPSRKHRIAWLLLVAAALLALNVYLFRAYLLPPMPRRETPSPIVPEPEPPAPPPESEPKSPAPPVAEFPPLPPEPPPGSEIADGHPTPPVPEPSLPESSEPSIAIEPAPDQFLAVVDLLAKSAGLTQRRAVDVAIRGLEQWCAEQPSHPLLPWVNLELRGLRRLRAAIERLAASGGRAAGVPLDSTPGVTGEVIRILPNHQVSVIRRFGEGTGIVEVDLWRLGDADLDRLFHAANGENGPLDAAAWAIGQGQWRRAMELLARLAGEDAEFLRQWLEARQQVQREAAALRALEEARTLVQASRFREALATLRQARETVPEARVISWAAREAWNELERLAREEAERAPSSSEPPTASRRESPSAPDVGPAEAEEGETVFIRDLKQRPAAYHGKTVRLRFRTRGPIEELGEGRFKTTLTADDGIIEVEFPEEGWRWVNSLPEYFFDRGSPRYVYGVFDAENEVVRLIGRTRRIPMGGRSVEYTW